MPAPTKADFGQETKLKSPRPRHTRCGGKMGAKTRVSGGGNQNLESEIKTRSRE